MIDGWSVGSGMVLVVCGVGLVVRQQNTQLQARSSLTLLEKPQVSALASKRNSGCGNKAER
jgi:hypothetical protein